MSTVGQTFQIGDRLTFNLVELWATITPINHNKEWIDTCVSFHLTEEAAVIAAAGIGAGGADGTAQRVQALELNRRYIVLTPNQKMYAVASPEEEEKAMMELAKAAEKKISPAEKAALMGSGLMTKP